MDNNFQSFYNTILKDFVTEKQQKEIHEQLEQLNWSNNVYTLWTGVGKDKAQVWANQHHMQTLTSVMGSLMPSHRPEKLKDKSKYMKGASAIYSWFISNGERVVVVTPPPPQRFHPMGITNFQTIEEPIIKGRNLSQNSCQSRESRISREFQIQLVHPSVNGAEDFVYQFWPTDEMQSWINEYGHIAFRNTIWRPVTKANKNDSNKKRIEAHFMSPSFALNIESRRSPTNIIKMAESSDFDSNPFTYSSNSHYTRIFEVDTNERDRLQKYSDFEIDQRHVLSSSGEENHPHNEHVMTTAAARKRANIAKNELMRQEKQARRQRAEQLQRANEERRQQRKDAKRIKHEQFLREIEERRCKQKPEVKARKAQRQFKKQLNANKLMRQKIGLFKYQFRASTIMLIGGITWIIKLLEKILKWIES